MYNMVHYIYTHIRQQSISIHKLKLELINFNFNCGKTMAALLPSEAASPLAANGNPFPSTIAGKVKRAEALRAEGGAHYAAKRYKKAMRCYAKIPAWVQPFASDKAAAAGGGGGGGGEASAMAGMMGRDSAAAAATEEEQQASVTLMRIAHQNRAMCYVKLKKGKKALASCKKALAYNDGNTWKVWRAKAQACMLEHDLDAARAALDKTLELQGGTDKTTSKLLKHLDKLFAQHDKKEARRYRKAFGVKVNVEAAEVVGGAAAEAAAEAAAASPVVDAIG